MDSLGAPYPTSWSGAYGTVVAVIGSISGAIASVGAGATISELATATGAAGIVELATVAGGLGAAAWLGTASGCLASAAGEKLADLIPPVCCPDKSSCAGFSYTSPP